MKIFTLLLILIVSNSKNDYCLPFHKKDFENIRQEFGYTPPPIHGVKPYHQKGTVFNLKKDAKIRAIDNGIVKVSKIKKTGFGKHIEIHHSNQLKVTYYYLDKLKVVEGQIVKRGEIIGIAGNTGNTTQNGLGIQVQLKDSLLNPLTIITL